jgi:hypothetical protein
MLSDQRAVDLAMLLSFDFFGESNDGLLVAAMRAAKPWSSNDLTSTLTPTSTDAGRSRVRLFSTAFSLTSGASRTTARGVVKLFPIVRHIGHYLGSLIRRSRSLPVSKRVAYWHALEYA